MSTINDYDYQKDESLSDKWKYRFAFFEKNGYPGFWRPTPAWKQAFKQMTFGEKVTVNQNFYAFFFGCIYLFILGLWKKALTSIALSVLGLLVAALIGFPFLSFIVPMLIMMRTNVWYHEYKVKGIQTWGL